MVPGLSRWSMGVATLGRLASLQPGEIPARASRRDRRTAAGWMARQGSGVANALAPALHVTPPTVR